MPADCRCIGLPDAPPHDPLDTPLFGIPQAAWVLLPANKRVEGHHHLRTLGEAIDALLEGT